MPKKKPQSKPQSPKRGRGRPEGTGYHPTKEQRHLVKVMAGMGIPEETMVSAILNPATGKPISPVTLRAHFREELDQGFVQANAQVGASLFKNATTPTETYPGGIPVAQLFWLKCRARWQQNPERAPPVLAPIDPNASSDHRETTRRLAFLLAKEDSQLRKDQTPPPAAKPPKKSMV